MAEAIPIILNPAARSARAGARFEQIRALDPRPELHLTHASGEAAEIARRLARDGRRLIVAAGGDGTVNEVVQGICEVNATCSALADHVALGVLPVGTMNVFALELGMPAHDLQACWGAITAGRRQEIDLWLANSHYFVQLAGVGLDAEIIELTPWEMKKKFGPLSYVISAVKAWLRKPPLLSVRVDNRPPLRGSVALVGSGVHYGGPFPVFRTANNRDGLLDVLVFRELGSWQIAQLLRAVLIDGYEHSLDLDYLQVREITVTAEDRPVPFQVDGELCGTSPVVFKPAPFPLRVAF